MFLFLLIKNIKVLKIIEKGNFLRLEKKFDKEKY